MYKANNILTQEEIDFILKEIKNVPEESTKIDEILGRALLHNITFPDEIIAKASALAHKVSDRKLETGNGAMCTIYSNEYGSPNLPPHFDGDTTDVIVNFQLDSSTSWDLGLDLTLHTLEDNSALIFNPNENIHWRPYKEFKDGEYVTMIFFRFRDAAEISDYSHKSYTTRHAIFNDVRAYRDSLQ
jgi:hypothetical protein